MLETIEYAPWLRELAANASHPFVHNSEAMVQYLLELDSQRAGSKIAIVVDMGNPR